MYWRSMLRGLSCSPACVPRCPACRFGDPSTRPSPILPLALCLLSHSLPAPERVRHGKRAELPTAARFFLFLHPDSPSSARPKPSASVASSLASLPRTTVSAMDASQAEARAAATRARGLAAAPCHGASGAQPRARCGHPVSCGSSSPPVAPHNIAAIGLRAAEPHAHVASPPHSSSGRAEGTIGCARDRTCSPPLVAIDCRLSGRIRRSPVPPLLPDPVKDFVQQLEQIQGSNCEVSDSSEQCLKGSICSCLNCVFHRDPDASLHSFSF